MKEIQVEELIFIGEGNGTPLQYCCLENLMDGGVWQVTPCGVTNNPTGLSKQHTL